MTGGEPRPGDGSGPRCGSGVADGGADLADQARRDVAEAVVVTGVTGDGGEDVVVGGCGERPAARGDDVATGELLHGYLRGWGETAVRRTAGVGQPACAAASCTSSRSTRTMPRAAPCASTHTIGSNRVSSGRAAPRWATSLSPADAGTRRLTGARRCPGGSPLRRFGSSRQRACPCSSTSTPTAPSGAVPSSTTRIGSASPATCSVSSACAAWRRSRPAAQRNPRRSVVSRVLIAEDEARIAAFVEKGLRANGFATAVVGDGRAARAAAASGDFDLMILDIGLPGMDGFEVLRALRADRVSIPVVILTARDSVQDTVAALEGGADDYMPKPLRFEELLARVRLRLF